MTEIVTNPEPVSASCNDTIFVISPNIQQLPIISKPSISQWKEDLQWNGSWRLQQSPCYFPYGFFLNLKLRAWKVKFGTHRENYYIRREPREMLQSSGVQLESSSRSRKQWIILRKYVLQPVNSWKRFKQNEVIQRDNSYDYHCSLFSALVGQRVQ